ncbi:MAG: exopolysaccharide biosynthesis protein [Tahibacter sp.]
MADTQHDLRTTELLQQALDANTDATITLEQFLAPLETRAYGFLLVLLALPNFIPIPVGIGGVCGVLLIVVGAQMLVGLARPWIPAFARRHGFRRSSVEHFVQRTTPLFARLERICKPRWEHLTRSPVSHFNGLLLVLLGILLALPIPFTNYPFGFVMLLFGVALIERDGGLLAVVWTTVIVALATVGSLSHAIIEQIGKLFG